MLIILDLKYRYLLNAYLITSINNQVSTIYPCLISFCLGILPNGEFMYILSDDPENYDFNHMIPF